jgi:hypothetical protein
MNGLRQRGALVFGLFFALAVARAEFASTDPDSVGSVTGQFFVSSAGGSSLPAAYLNPNGDTNVIQLKSTLLAVSAERFKVSLWHQLGIQPDAAWSGKIFLEVHPARSLDEAETIATMPFLDHWNYRVDLPDTLEKTRYARMLSGVLLLEIADRRAPPGGHAAELPAWLVDGLAQQVLAEDGEKVLLAIPPKKGLELPASRISQSERGFDPMARVRQILQNNSALTFDQLSWPTDDQMNGADGGVYYASAQLFQAELLELKNGKEKMRAMLADLPNHLNWQLAFFNAFAADFKNHVGVDKWWALRVVNFAARGSGPHWTTGASIGHMQELLTVPVEFRSGSNSLPAHADVSLQVALQSLNADQRESVVRTKVRDLALIELRLAPPFGELADAYRVALVNFLGESQNVARPSVINKHAVPITGQSTVAETVKRLNALDVRWRTAESQATVALQAAAQSGNQRRN